VGSTIAIGPRTKLKIVKRIVRCAATEADPDTGIRDLPVPRLLMDTYYAEVVADGPVAPGDVSQEAEGPQAKLPF
jgi:uncharacterized protein